MRYQKNLESAQLIKGEFFFQKTILLGYMVMLSFNRAIG